MRKVNLYKLIKSEATSIQNCIFFFAMSVLIGKGYFTNPNTFCEFGHKRSQFMRVLIIVTTNRHVCNMGIV